MEPRHRLDDALIVDLLRARAAPWRRPCVFILACLLVGSLQAKVYYTEDQALREVYGKAAVFAKREIALSEKERNELGRSAKAKFWEKKIRVYEVQAEEKLRGCAFVMNEIGKYKHITFLVAIEPGGKVERVLVLVYREPQGGEVRYRKFLRQFEGKSAKDKIQPGRDIVNIAGGTLSVRSVAKGVRKALSLAQRYCR